MTNEVLQFPNTSDTFWLAAYWTVWLFTESFHSLPPVLLPGSLGDSSVLPINLFFVSFYSPMLSCPLQHLSHPVLSFITTDCPLDNHNDKHGMVASSLSPQSSECHGPQPRSITGGVGSLCSSGKLIKGGAAEQMSTVHIYMRSIDSINKQPKIYLLPVL